MVCPFEFFGIWPRGIQRFGIELDVSIGDQVDTSQWLNEIHCSKAVGLKDGNADAVYAHSMYWRYPVPFIGKDITLILSTMTIKILELYDAWRGSKLGDGMKECLTSDMQMAVHRHRQYCEDFVPGGILRETAIKTAEFTLLFWNALVTYTKDEYRAQGHSGWFREEGYESQHESRLPHNSLREQGNARHVEPP